MTPEQQQGFYDNNPQARWLVLVSVCLVLFLAALTLSAVNIAVPAIARDLQADAVAVSWIPTALLWGTTVLLLPAGRVADILGRKKVYLIGVSGFSLASVLVLAAATIEILLLIRVLQGLASALVFATGMAIISAVFANANRGAALGITSSAVYLGLTCGPLAGGWLTEWLGWRSVFWAPVPFMLLAWLLAVRYIRGDWKSTTKARLDWKGSLIFAAWLSAVFIGMSGLPDPAHFGWIGLGAVLLVWFVKQQEKAAHPLVRLSVLRENRVFFRSITASFLMYGANFPIIFLLSLYLQYIHQMSPSVAGQLILIQTGVMVVLAPIAGRLSDRYEPRIIATLGCLCYSLGFGVLFWLDTDTPVALIITALTLLGIGFGLFSTPNNNAAIGAVPADRLSIATALLNLSRTLGNMAGMAVVMMLFSWLLGNAEITPEQYPALIWVTRLAVGLSCLYALVAGYYSLTRGRVHVRTRVE
ncbi:MFS transporter [Marinobacterium rhizophilum]|uniref:MFS transporter n=1 Tax=Marinobacterium rhizophilum TaxID=420402 RepID=A0ABY5HNS6_9GAMM|nr:MFS transporter [Marinobacterium rhizophilum]UTW12904.1 MFS transporter [Marinobacterium rhizophilum]